MNGASVCGAKTCLDFLVVFSYSVHYAADLDIKSFLLSLCVVFLVAFLSFINVNSLGVSTAFCSLGLFVTAVLLK